MDRFEDEEWLSRCNGCGAELSPESHPTFAFGVSGVLCFACATKRGGTFDGRRDDWSEPPDVRDLGPGAQE